MLTLKSDRLSLGSTVVTVESLSSVLPFVTPWTTHSPIGSSVHRISQKECWSGLPFPPPGDLPDPGVEPMSPALAGEFFTAEPPGKLQLYCRVGQKVRSDFPIWCNRKTQTKLFTTQYLTCVVWSKLLNCPLSQ